MAIGDIEAFVQGSGGVSQPQIIESVTTVTTTDGTLTTLATVPVPASTSLYIDAKIVALRTGGSAGTALDSAAYRVAGCYKLVSSTATEVGETSIFSAEDQAAWSVTFTPSSGDVLIQVTGAANNTVNWKCSYRLLSVT